MKKSDAKGQFFEYKNKLCYTYFNLAPHNTLIRVLYYPYIIRYAIRLNTSWAVTGIGNYETDKIVQITSNYRFPNDYSYKPIFSCALYGSG